MKKKTINERDLRSNFHKKNCTNIVQLFTKRTVLRVRQKKGTSFLYASFFQYLTETGHFFTYINESISFNFVYLILA